jgi:hypothetical protein
MYCCLVSFGSCNDAGRPKSFSSKDSSNTMTTIHYVDAQNQPLVDAVVGISSAPHEVTDIGMVTDGNGDISIDVAAAGEYVFSVSHNGRTQHVSANLHPGDSTTTIVVR